jgi:hypothetical protein
MSGGWHLPSRTLDAAFTNRQSLNEVVANQDDEGLDTDDDVPADQFAESVGLRVAGVASAATGSTMQQLLDMHAKAAAEQAAKDHDSVAAADPWDGAACSPVALKANKSGHVHWDGASSDASNDPKKNKKKPRKGPVGKGGVKAVADARAQVVPRACLAGACSATDQAAPILDAEGEDRTLTSEELAKGAGRKKQNPTMLADAQLRMLKTATVTIGNYFNNKWPVLARCLDRYIDRAEEEVRKGHNRQGTFTDAAKEEEFRLGQVRQGMFSGQFILTIALHRGYICLAYHSSTPMSIDSHWLIFSEFAR